MEKSKARVFRGASVLPSDPPIGSSKFLQYDTIVIGAGPAGLAAASKLSDAGQNIVVAEAASSVGGMARSFELWDRIVDVGPHRFFSSDPRINQFWIDACGGSYKMVHRKTRIFYRGKFFTYPLTAKNALTNLGLVEALRCVFSLMWAKIRPHPLRNETFSGWVTFNFGRRLYEIFFEEYTEKLWGIPPDELGADFAVQRIKKFSLFAAMKAMILPGTSRKHRTLVDEFAYPLRGAGEPWENLASKISERGGSVLLGAAVEAIEREPTGNWQVTLSTGDSIVARNVISTMPLPLLTRMLGAPHDVLESASRLKFRSTTIVYLRIPRLALFPDQWLYVNSPGLQTGRITNFNNWNHTILKDSKDTVLAFEYWSSEGDDFWNAKEEEIGKIAMRDLRLSGLSNLTEAEAFYVLRVPKCYPIYEGGYERDVKKISLFVDSFPNIQAIGRYGSFKYNNQDHSILMGLLAAENVLAESVIHDTWGINSDREYQEGSRITASGLVLD